MYSKMALTSVALKSILIRSSFLQFYKCNNISQRAIFVNNIEKHFALQKPSSRLLYLGCPSRAEQQDPLPTGEALKGDGTTTEEPLKGDRTKQIPVETSDRYLQSDAYKTTYGDSPVWTQYRRNHKGVFAPQKTRKTCIRQGKISTGNPCPICRDEYLVLDARNTELLKQFISPHNGEVLSYKKTGLCQKRHEELLVAVHKAYDVGLVTFDVPYREYDYSQYFKV